MRAQYAVWHTPTHHGGIWPSRLRRGRGEYTHHATTATAAFASLFFPPTRLCCGKEEGRRKERKKNHTQQLNQWGTAHSPCKRASRSPPLEKKGKHSFGNVPLMQSRRPAVDLLRLSLQHCNAFQHPALFYSNSALITAPNYDTVVFTRPRRAR